MTSRNAWAMPAAAPIPQEVAKCFEGKPGAYGRFVISSGPYMIEGSDDLDISSCGAMKPISGLRRQDVADARPQPELQGEHGLDGRPGRTTRTASSSPSTRTSTTSTTRSAAGDLEDEYATASPKVFREYSLDASKRKYLQSNSGDQTYYITMNLTQPPFDDVHVRRAMNWVMDRHGLRKAWGGPIAGEIAEHILPNAMLRGKLNGFQPFKTPGDRGSVAKAKAEMKQSKYANSGGVCTAKECKGVLLIKDVAHGGQGDAAGRPGERDEDRHHLHGAHGQRRVPGDPDAVEERPDLERARAGARTTRTRRRSSTRCSTAATSSRPATRTTRSSG